MKQTVCENSVQIDLDALDRDYPDVDGTQRKELVDARVGQGKWRKQLDRYWTGCSVTGCKIQCLLRGSHIKPWRDSSNHERLNSHNGLLLRADIDALFDRGMISFSDSGEIILSGALTQIEIEMLPFNLDLRIVTLTDEHLGFLEYHREVELVEV